MTNQGMELVSRTATCKRCSSETVAWQTGKTGKWYLTEVFQNETGMGVTSHTDFHSKYCGKPEQHSLEQAMRDKAYAEAKQNRDEISAEREQAQREAEAAQLAIFIDMSPDMRVEHIEELKDALEKERRDPVSMDYFTEHCRWVQKCEAMRAEIDLYEDFMEELA